MMASPAQRGSQLQIWIIVVAVGAVLGLLFSGVSTYDFTMHLDRQVHDVHCSFIPGLDDDHTKESGCEVTLVSPYSSVLRTTIWGGIPISLPAMAVFAFLLAFAVDLAVTRRGRNRHAAGFLLLATALPTLTSLVMAYVSLVHLDAVCKLCIGVYLSSAVCLGGAIGLFITAQPGSASAAPTRRRRKSRPATLPDEPAWTGAAPISASAPESEPEHEADEVDPSERPAAVAWSYLGLAFAVGVLFVLVPVASYVASAPEHERFIGTCGSLVEPAPPELLIPVDPRPGKPPTLEILDPLCPACLGFEGRVEASGLAGEMDRRAVLMPLDDSCNWMVTSAVHPGACAVSRAMICAGDDAPQVLGWAFDQQEQIRKAAAADPKAAAQMAGQAFPNLASCIDAPATKAKLNRSLRWAVKNRLPVLTPQLYVGGVKLCEEDVDIGLDFALDRMLSAQREGRLKAEANDEVEPAAPEPAEPSEPAAEPSEPAAEPSEPAAEPSEPGKPGDSAPGEPSGPAKAGNSAAEPSEPAAEPEPAEPGKPDDSAAEPTPKPSKPGGGAKPPTDGPKAEPPSDGPKAEPDEGANEEGAP